MVGAFIEFKFRGGIDGASDVKDYLGLLSWAIGSLLTPGGDEELDMTIDYLSGLRSVL